jgi:FixJ family two-component response regulator
MNEPVCPEVDRALDVRVRLSPRGERGSVFVRSPSKDALAMTPSIRSDATSVVFVVDDDPDVRSGLKLLLESVDLDCVTFASVQDFLLSKPSGGSHCLILDIRMPGMGGLDFQKELVEARNKIPVIFITGHGDIPMTVDAMKAGAVDFLTKPLREQDVLDAVRAALALDRTERRRTNELSDLQHRYETLSEREREVMTYAVAGTMNKETAARISLSESTIKAHRHNLMRKMDAHSVADLVRIADTLGIGRSS